MVVFVRAKGETGGLRRVYLDPPTGGCSMRRPAAASSPGHTTFTSRCAARVRRTRNRRLRRARDARLVVERHLPVVAPAAPSAQDFGFRARPRRVAEPALTFGLYGVARARDAVVHGIFLAFPTPVAQRSARSRRFRPRRGACRPPSRAGRSRQTMPPRSPAAISRCGGPGVGIPAGPRGAYRVALREARRRASAAVPGFVVRARERSAPVSIATTQTRGDAFLAYQRPLHEGDALGFAGRVVVCGVGLLPALFLVTGTMMWLRSRRKGGCRVESPGQRA